MIRYGFILLTICLCASLVLSVTYKITQARIGEQLTAGEKSALKEVFADATAFEDKNLDGETYYVAKKDGQEIGYVIKTEAKGYSSTIVMLVGFDKTGEIEGLEVLSQQETPGLGAKMVEVKPGEEKPWFLQQFEGKKTGDLNLQTIHAITAATISSKAVVESVKKSVEEFLAKVK